MSVPFSDYPEDVVRRNIASLLHGFGDLEQSLIAYGADETTLALSQSLLMLLGGLRSEFDGDHTDAVMRIRAVIEQLSTIT